MNELPRLTHAVVWRPSRVRVCVDILSDKTDACALVWQPCVCDVCVDEMAARGPRSWVFFQRSSPWCGSASVVVCTRVLSAELDRCLLKSV